MDDSNVVTILLTILVSYGMSVAHASLRAMFDKWMVVRLFEKYGDIAVTLLRRYPVTT